MKIWTNKNEQLFDETMVLLYKYVCMHIYIYICICMCVYVCAGINS